MKGRTLDCVFCTLYALWDAVDEMGDKRHVVRASPCAACATFDLAGARRSALIIFLDQIRSQLLNST